MGRYKLFLGFVFIAFLIGLLPGAGIALNQQSLVIEVTVEGLEGDDVAILQLVPDSRDLEAALFTKGITLPEVVISNGIHEVKGIDIPNGVYKLVINTPPEYFREPMGYLLGVAEDQIVIQSRFTLPLTFKLVSPSSRELPTCRDFTVVSPGSPGADPTADEEEVCVAEYLADLFGPVKPLPPEEASGLALRTTGYHFAGVQSSRNNKGVWGRNYVVDPSVCRICGTEFLAEWVMSDVLGQPKWIQAGWAEVSWRDDKQYIFEYDTGTNRWNWFDQYQISSGSPVETRVRYIPSISKWRASYYTSTGWATLVEEGLGFTTATRGNNMGEQYTSSGNHSSLPVSDFDKGYLRLSGVWELWDSRYTSSTTISQDPPYNVNMINEYYIFDVYSS